MKEIIIPIEQVDFDEANTFNDWKHEDEKDYLNWVQCFKNLAKM